MAQRKAHYKDYSDMTEVVTGVFINDGGVYIVDDEGEVVCWVESEWIEDPTVTINIAFAIALATAKGASAVRENIKNKGCTLVDFIKSRMQYVYADGTPVTSGHCCTPDHFVSTFVVAVRSMTSIGENTLKSLIQRKHEVLSCDKQEEVCVIRETRPIS